MVQGTMSEVGETLWFRELNQKWERQWDSANYVRSGRSQKVRFSYLCHKWERQCGSGNSVRSGRDNGIQLTVSQVGEGGI